MIPPKLYIPTSTLNFNNIMSSESISPASFYTKRRFGYKRFEKVAPNNLDNLILLYDKYPIFDINDKELENYPMVIEIDTQYISDDNVCEINGVYYTTRSIYFNPYTTRIIFRTSVERALSLSKSEPSIESKLTPLYQGQFVVLSTDIETFNWSPTNIEDLRDYDNNAVSFDISINKLKGMLYGYLLGANKSYSKEIVALKRKIKDLRNVLSAMLASPDGRATHFQQQQLDNIYAGINQDFYALSKVQSRIDEIIAQKNEDYNTLNFADILKREGLYQEWFQKQVSQLNLRYYQINPFRLSYQATDKVAELDLYINEIEKAIQFYDVKTQLDITKLPVLQNRRIAEVPEQKEILPILFCEYMDEVWNGNEFLTSRYDFAKVGGKLFKSYIGDEKWPNSPVRSYINSLLKNLNEYTEFDINSSDSDFLKSFAAFCQKGEKDIDKLGDYLVSSGIGDFRIAYALWGLIFGFAEMPKTLTNDLFDSKDEQYISDCYKYIYKQLHSIELEGSLDRTIKKEEKLNSVWDGVKNIGNRFADLFRGNSEDQRQNIDSLKAESPVEHKVTYIPEELKVVFDSDAFKKLAYAAQQYFKQNSLALYKGVIDKTYIEALKKLEYPKSKTNWSNAIKTLTPKQKKEKNKRQDADLFMFDRLSISSKTSLKYPNETNFILSLECLKDIPNKAIERIIDAFGFTANEKNKEEHIKYFTSICINEGRGYKNDGNKVKNMGLLGIYTEELNEKVKSEIEKRYDEYRQ